MNFNPFVLMVALMQFGGTWWYIQKGQLALGILYFLYGLTNINILFVEGIK